jgi:hypothetical protein
MYNIYKSEKMLEAVSAITPPLDGTYITLFAFPLACTTICTKNIRKTPTPYVCSYCKKLRSIVRCDACVCACTVW